MKLPSLNLDQAAIFFDFDGTLVDLQQTPEAVVVSEELSSMLKQLEALSQGAIAIVSGRDIGSLDKLLQLKELTLSGSHGMEYRYGNHSGIRLHPDAVRIDPDVYTQAKRFCHQYGLIWEAKPLSIAIHYRKSPALEDRVEAFLAQFVTETSGLEVQTGKFIRELKPTGIHKSSALSLLMEQAPFAGRTPWYFGDDVTDEDAFTWINQHQGISVKVGNGRTQAKYQIDSPDDVLKFFQTNLIKEES